MLLAVRGQVIKPEGGGKVRLFTANGARSLGPVTSREQAQKQEVAIKISEAKRGKGEFFTPRPKR